jgi:Holliday junction resolvase RusA-like endonuclease
MNKIEVQIKIEPRCYQSDGIGFKNGKPHVYKTEEKREYQKAVYYLMRKELGRDFRKLRGNLIVRKLIYYISTKWEILWGSHCGQEPDLTDNLQKPLFDAIKDRLIEDDCKVVEMHNLKKVWSEIPGIDIWIEEIE